MSLVDAVVEAKRQGIQHSLRGSNYESDIPPSLKALLDEALRLANEHSIPLYWSASLPNGVMTRAALGEKGENIHIQYLMSYAAAVQDPALAQEVVQKGMAFLDKK